MAEAPTRAPVVTLGTAATAILTVSSTAGSWVIVRNIHVTNETAAEIRVTLGISTSPAADAATGKRIYSSIPLAGNSALDWSGFMVLLAGEVLYGLANAANSATVAVSGVSGP